MAKGKGIALTFDLKLALAVLTVKARAKSLDNAKKAHDEAVSEMNKIIDQRLKDEDIKENKDAKLLLFVTKQDPISALDTKLEKLTTAPLELRKLADKFKDKFSTLNPKVAPAAASKTPASK